ncbi:glycosyltransferase 87 family protein [Rhodococcus sp. IEGM 1408]|uniref:glycosyltransferase 87 family protein n=1 Tax=Rhodococcus sp. IEGM 1408 TaxID=3082220 RepID=UPI0029554E8F|nr:glycosyltransferase 87 family protein [Rhodococcus sp. IEGM 1408]MDV8000083.1 glycosyltransferase 87 family protein [Rhodococcus sp. IEGM 1408]
MISRAMDRYLASTAGRVVVAVLALLGTVLHTVGVPGLQQIPPYRIDLDVYRVGGQVFRDGGEIYGELPRLAQGAHLPFTYPPLSAQLFSVFTLVPLAVASTLITLATIATLGYVVQLVLTRTCDRPQRELWWLTVAVLAVALWFGPVRETLGFGQVNVFLMALVLIDLIRGRGRWWGGTLTGLAMAIKLTPAVFLLYFVLRRDWRGLGTAVVAALAFTGIGHLLTPDDSVRFWTFALRDPARIGGLAFSSNQSVNGVVHRFGLEGSAASVAWFVVSALVGLGIAWVAWRLLRAGHEVAAVVAVGHVALFCSPVSWGHHWVWAVPAVVLALVWAARAGERGDDDERGWLVLAGSGIVVFLGTPQWWVPHSEDRELGWGPIEHLVGNAYLIWALVFLVVIGVRAARLGSPDLGGDPERTALFQRATAR